MRFLTGKLISSSSVIKKYLPSFSAVKSLLITRNVTLTNEAYTPIIPHPAKDYDTINTAMLMFSSKKGHRTALCGVMKEFIT